MRIGPLKPLLQLLCVLLISFTKFEKLGIYLDSKTKIFIRRAALPPFMRKKSWWEISQQKCQIPTSWISLFLEKFDISIHPSKPLKTKEVLWSPPPIGWIKCNIYGLAIGSPNISFCEGIFRDDKAFHIGSFCAYLYGGTSESVELTTTMVAIEKVMEFHWKKLWIEKKFMLVVKSFSNSNLVPWNIKSRWLNCWSFTLPIDFIITHIYKEANFVLISLLTLV